ncbi:MAG: hypothetical protein EG825_12120 [Rhodocyclaceae bacterium]|nr:hypothetical protein [Rhodocyclaceae bacterium]
MKSALAALAIATFLLLAAGTSRAEPAEQKPAPAVVDPMRLGYAFEHPRILTQQRLFGLAHGISLLAASCLDVPERMEEVQDAYAAWRERQAGTIDDAVGELSTYYFGLDAAADWQHLTGVMRLRDTLPFAPESDELKAACATFAQALRRPRYDLVAQFRLQELLSQITVALETDARAVHCKTKLPGDSLTLLEARYGVWREINEPVAHHAREVLEKEWATMDNGPARSLEEWIKAMRQEARVRGSIDDCLRFSEWLKSPEAALRQAFHAVAPPEPLAAPEVAKEASAALATTPTRRNGRP